MRIHDRFHANQPMIDIAIQERYRYRNIAGMPAGDLRVKDTVTSRTVADCFATDAESIYDAFTNETWIKEGGSFVKVD